MTAASETPLPAGNGRESHDMPQTEPTKAISAPYLSGLKISRLCCCGMLFSGSEPVGGAGRLATVTEHPSAAASRAGDQSPECQPNLEKAIWMVVAE